MIKKSKSHRTTIRYSGIVDVSNPSVSDSDRYVESSYKAYPVLLKPHCHKYARESSKNNSVEQSKSKSARKYKISFSYACSNNQDTNNINPKIIDLQRLDKRTTKSDLRFVSDKLKPVMACVVKRLIQEYKSSNDQSLENVYRRKYFNDDSPSISSSTAEDYSFATCRKVVNGDTETNTNSTESSVLSYPSYNCPRVPEQLTENIGLFKSGSKSKSRYALRRGVTRLTHRLSQTGDSQTKSHSKAVFTKPLVHIIPTYSKDFYLFKRKKTAVYFNFDISSLEAVANLIHSCPPISYYTNDNIIVRNEIPLFIAVSEQPPGIYADLCISDKFSYRRNMHFPVYHVEEEHYRDQVVNCRHEPVWMTGNLDSYENYNQLSIHGSNGSNYKDNDDTEKGNKSQISMSSMDELISPVNVDTQNTNPKKVVSDDSDTSFDSEFLRQVKKNEELPPKMFCKLIKKMSRTSLQSGKSDNSESDDSSDSVCRICNGDPVICFESEARKSLIENYVRLLEEAQDIEVRRLSDQTFDMEHLKDLLYNFMEEKNAYPSEDVKRDIIQRRSLAPNSEIVGDNVPSAIDNNVVRKGRNSMIDSSVNTYKTITKTINTSYNITETVEYLDTMSEGEIGKKYLVMLEEKVDAPDKHNTSPPDNYLPVNKLNNTEGKVVFDDVDILMADISNSIENNAVNLGVPSTTRSSLSINTRFVTPPVIVAEKEEMLLHSTQQKSLIHRESRHFQDVTPVKTKTSVIHKPIQSVEIDAMPNSNYVTPSVIVTQKDGPLSHPIQQKPSIHRESRHFQDVTPVKTKTNSIHKPNQAVEIDTLPNNDIFVEIDDHFQRPSISNKITENNETLPFTSVSSSKTPKKISTYGDTIPDEEISSESSSETSGSQDTSEDISSTYSNEIANGKEIFDNISVEDDDKLLYSLKKNANKQKTSIPPKKISHITSYVVDVDNNRDKLSKEIDTFDAVLARKDKETDVNIMDRLSSKRDTIKKDTPMANEMLNRKTSGISNNISNEPDTYSKAKSLSKDNALENHTQIDSNIISMTKMTSNDLANAIHTISNKKSLSKDNNADSQTQIYLNTLNDNVELSNKIGSVKDTSSNTHSLSKGNTVDNHTQIDTNIVNEKRKTISTNIGNKEIFIDSTHTHIVNKIVQTEIVDDTSNFKEKFIYQTNKFSNDKDVAGDLAHEKHEMDDLLNKLRNILYKSESYLHMLSNISNCHPDPENKDKETVNVPLEIISLMKNLCSKKNSRHASPEDRYKSLTTNLEGICRSLSAMDSKERNNSLPRQHNERHGLDNFTHSNSRSPDKNSLCDRLLRDIMSRLNDDENQERKKIVYTPNNYMDSHFSDPTNHRHFNYDYAANKGFVSPKSTIDSLIQECMPQTFDNVQNPIDKQAVYNEMACRMNDLLHQVKRSQIDADKMYGNVKIQYPNMYTNDEGGQNRPHSSRLPRSLSASDINDDANCFDVGAIRHTVASIQNIKSSTNQVRKIKNGFRNLRNEVRDKAGRLMLLSKTRQKMLCSNPTGENLSNNSVKRKVGLKIGNKKKNLR